jgi:hypothetical protein
MKSLETVDPMFPEGSRCVTIISGKTRARASDILTDFIARAIFVDKIRTSYKLQHQDFDALAEWLKALYLESRWYAFGSCRPECVATAEDVMGAMRESFTLQSSH